jgi:hypothetical protein
MRIIDNMTISGTVVWIESNGGGIAIYIIDGDLT